MAGDLAAGQPAKPAVGPLAWLFAAAYDFSLSVANDCPAPLRGLTIAGMPLDVVDLRNFYGQALGAVARRFVGRGIRARWQDLHGLRVLGIGYPTPYLGLFRDQAERCLAFMPAAQGVVRWPSDRPALAALVEDDELPLPDAAVWRALAAGGRVLVIVPNRRGVWARIDTTPFGHGHPYSRPQITHLLRETWFTPTGWDEAVYLSPMT